MNENKILEKAIRKAMEGGYPYTIHTITWPSSLGTQTVYTRRGGISEISIFDHDFAKALWGEEERDSLEESKAKGVTINDKGLAYTVKRRGWQYHLQQMVIAEDPVKYLGENI